MEIQDKFIVVYEPAPGRRFEPVMRFILIDDVMRNFAVERMCYSGHTHWRPLHEWGPVSVLARRYIRYIGKESFYEIL